MKQNFLMGLVIVGCSSFLYADTVKSIEDIDKHIHKYQVYLDEIDFKIVDIIKTKVLLEKKKNEVELKIKKYLEVLDSCLSSKLDKVSEQLCTELVMSDYGDRLKKKRKRLQEAIKVNNMKKNRLKAEIRDISTIKKGVRVLKDVKKILILK